MSGNMMTLPLGLFEELFRARYILQDGFCGKSPSVRYFRKNHRVLYMPLARRESKTSFSGAYTRNTTVRCVLEEAEV